MQITYDPSRTSYVELLDVFWRQIDPTDTGGQFVDRGRQYRSAIFYRDEQQKRLAEKSKEELAASGKFSKPIVTEILPASTFYKAEGYHQDFYKQNPKRYHEYRSGSGRDPYLDKVWGKDRTPPRRQPATAAYTGRSKDELKRTLTPIQYKVTQEDGTEPAYENAYWDNHREGIYVDIVSGEPLFSSRDKYESGTGWPSFTRPLQPANIVERPDNSLFTRTDRGPQQARRVAPGPRLPRRPASRGPAILHELGCPPVRPEGGPGEGRVRAVQGPVREAGRRDRAVTA